MALDSVMTANYWLNSVRGMIKQKCIKKWWFLDDENL